MMTDPAPPIDDVAPPLSEADEASSPRIKIGSQRGGVSTKIITLPVMIPKPVTPASPPPGGAKVAAEKKAQAPTKYYPPPNIRDRLTPDLELEFTEAIGGVAIDEMLSGNLAGFEAELEPEAKVQGTVLAVLRDAVFLDLGGASKG